MMFRNSNKPKKSASEPANAVIERQSEQPTPSDIALSQVDKVAILMLSMGEESAAYILKQLTHSQVVAISNRMATMNNLSSEKAEEALTDFFNTYRSDSGIQPPAQTYIEKTLGIALGEAFSQSVLQQMFGDKLSQSIRQLEWVKPEHIAQYLEGEHLQLSAVMLALMEPDLAQKVLNCLNDTKQKNILVRMAQLKKISPEMSETIIESIDSCANYAYQQSNSMVNGVEKTANLLSRVTSQASAVMSELRDAQADIAEKVEEKIFDFSCLAHQTEDTLAFLFNEIDSELWLASLKYSEETVKKAIMASLPSRLSNMFEQRLQDITSMDRNRPVEAKKSIMQQVKDFHQDKKITFLFFNDTA